MKNLERHRNPCAPDDRHNRRIGAEPAPVSTKKVDGTDNVYVFRYGNHQSMFVVTSQGVIATDPISYERPAKPISTPIKAVTDKPIKIC